MTGSRDRTFRRFYVVLLLLCCLPLRPVHAQPTQTVGAIRLAITNVYSRREVENTSGLLQLSRRLMNGLHPGTRQYVIRREILMRPGDPLDEELLHETERNLRSLGFLNNVTIVPIDTLPGGIVDLEVRVQEAWSLTTSANFSHASRGNRWGAYISDDNFLGHGVQLEAGLGSDEDRNFRQLVYSDRRLLSSPFAVRLTWADFSDGFDRSVALARPYYSEGQGWGLESYVWDRSYEPRYYLDPDRLGGSGDRLYANLPLDERGAMVWAGCRVRGGQGRRVWRIGFGVSMREKDYAIASAVRLSDGRLTTGDALRVAAGDGLGLEVGKQVRPLLVIETLGRRWAAETRIRKLGPVEDLNLDPWLRLSCGPTLTAFSSDRERFLAEWKLQDWSRLGPGLAFLRFEGKGSLGSPRNRMANVSLEGGWFVRSGRRGLNSFTCEAGASANAPGDAVLALGLTRGLRTLEYDGRVGDRLLRWNLEHVELLPCEVLGFYSVGLAAFYDGGDAWWRGDGTLIDIRHEAGFGLRFGPTRSARSEVARLDLAWPLDGGGPVVTAATGGFF